jgi:hypothetical protein
MPAQLIQFWKCRLNDRGRVGLVASGIAEIIYTRREKSHQKNPAIISFMGGFEIGWKHQIRFAPDTKAVNNALPLYFFNERM